MARIAPVTRSWEAFYRTVVSSRVVSGLDDYLWKQCYKRATWSHPKKRKPWIVGRYFGRFHPGRTDPNVAIMDILSEQVSLKERPSLRNAARIHHAPIGRMISGDRFSGSRTEEP